MDNMSDILKVLGNQMGTDTSKIEPLLKMMSDSNLKKTNTSEEADNDVNTQTNSQPTALPAFEMPDIETILKIKKIIEKMNSSTNDPIINLLIALKPFIIDSKKSIIDQIIKFIEISSALYLFNDL